MRRHEHAGEIGWEAVIEETLRRDAPIRYMPLRYAVEDIDLGDVVIKKGDPILLAFGAAGRAPAFHGYSACEFDATRESTDHLAFGHGVHFCLGAPLGRMEAHFALRALFGAFPDLALAVPESELVPQASFIAHDYQRLPVIPRPAEVVAAAVRPAPVQTMPPCPGGGAVRPAPAMPGGGTAGARRAREGVRRAPAVPPPVRFAGAGNGGARRGPRPSPARPETVGESVGR